jgi:NAD(P)H-flavin reductase
MLILPIRDTVVATPRAHIIKLDLQGQSFRYRPGQAAYLQPADTSRRRPYSIASAPEETERMGLIEFLVQTDPSGAAGLSPDLIRPGARVTLDGPLGSFVFPEDPKERRLLFIAGGTGIAPLRSMLRHALLAEQGPGRTKDIGLIYSVRSPEEFAYREEFDRLAVEGRLTFRHTVTRRASDGWPGRLGRIDVACLKDMIEPDQTLCFVCGPPALVGEIPPQLKQLGVRDDQIRMEQWLA